MSQRHMDLLMEAVSFMNENNNYLCNCLSLVTKDVDDSTCQDLKQLIMNNINTNLKEDEEVDYVGQVFESSVFHARGMSRKEWANTILAPLALELPDE